MLFDVGGEELLILSSSSFGVLPTLLTLLSDGALSAETFLSDEALDFGGFEESLISAFDLTTDNVFAHIILLLVESEGLDNVVATLHAESVGAVDISDTFNFFVALLHDSQEESSDIGTDNAATAGLAGAFTSTHGFVAGTTYNRKVLSTLLKLLLNICDLEQETLHTNETGKILTFLVENAGSAVDQDTLLHLETLLVVTASNFEDVALELFTHDFAVNFLTHSPVVEGTATQQMEC